MSLDNLAIEYRIELPTAEEFERLFRSSGWTEALGVAADRLAATLPHAWYAVCARRGGQVVGTGLVLSDGVLHALIVNVIVKRLVARCQEAGVLQVQLFSARGKRGFYERLGFVARPDDGPGMELDGLRSVSYTHLTLPPI